MEEFERHTEQSNVGGPSIDGHPEASQGQRVHDRRFNSIWQELKLAVSDIMNQPAIIQ